MLGGAVVAALTEAVGLGAWTMLFWAPLLVCAVAGTVFAVRLHTAGNAMPASAPPQAAEPGLSGAGSTRKIPDRSDTLFWDLFMGSAVALPALLIPTVMSPWAGAVLATLGGAAGLTAYRYSPRVLAHQELRRQRRQAQPAYKAAEALHQALLARWRSYELDPGCSIDYPAITDVRMPETSALIRAMREAERLQSVPHEGYVPAVARLEVSLAAAERAAGMPSSGR
jgi:hypothetical protein